MSNSKCFTILFLASALEICGRSNSGGDSDGDGFADPKAFDIILCQPEYDAAGNATVYADGGLDLVIQASNIASVVRATEEKMVELIGSMFENRVDFLNLTSLSAST